MPFNSPFTRIRLSLLAATLVSLVPFQVVGQTLDGFQTPSKNIHCLLERSSSPTDPPTRLRCDLLQNEAKLPPPPADCELDWGSAFVMGVRGIPQRICYGDTVANLNYPILAYGKTWRYQGITCISKNTGLTCTNRDQRGFELNRIQQRIF